MSNEWGGREALLITHHSLLIVTHHLRDASPPQVQPENRDRGGRNAWNAARLTERDRPNEAQLLHHLAREAGKRVREARRDAQLFIGACFRRFAPLALDVAGIAKLI